MIRKFYLFLLIGASHGVVAQQDPLYSQYLTNPLLFNPAYAGLNNAFNASLSFRNQWAGFEGSPSTVNLNSHLSLVDNKVGLGGMVLLDVMGPTKNTEAHFTGAYKLQLDKKDTYTLSFGMQVGFISSSNNYSQLHLDNPTDPAFAENLNFLWPNVGFGAILMSDKFLIGLSVPRMLKASNSDSGADFLFYNQHAYLFASYVYYAGTRLRLKPSLLLRGVQGAPLSVDLNFNINIDQKYTAGIFVRNFNSYGVMGQAWFLEKFRFGYAFELPSNKSVGPQFTSHEVTIGMKTAVLNIHDRSFSEF